MLDLFFRKYSWTATLLLLFAAAWLSARTFNTLVGVAIRPDPRAEMATAAPPPPRPSLPVALDMDAVYRLIGQQPPRVAEEAVPAGAAVPHNCDDPRAAPTKSEVRMALVAGVVTEKPRFSLATVADLGTRETHVLGIGDQISGMQLLSVERVRDDGDATGNGFHVVAIVCNGGRKEYLDFEPGAGEPAAAGAQNIGVAPVPQPSRPFAPGAPMPMGAPMAGVRQLSSNRYEVDRSVIESTMGDLNRIATQARIVPSFKNGVANGFKLFSIQPGSLYSSIGIENGDVIKRINGYEINSPDKALELLKGLPQTRHVSIEYERAGQSTITEVNVP